MPSPAGPNLTTALSPRTSLRAQDVHDVTDALHHALYAETQPYASIIHAATEFARILTGAHGVALGVQIKGVFVCRARSGDLAPELGSLLHADSGISGACLRSGSVVVCDDAVSDDRVNPEACRALGVRSIVATPVHGTTGPVGMLEAFSKEPSAFSGDRVEALKALTAIIETAHSFEIRERETRERDKAIDSTRALLARRISPATISPRGMRKAISEDKLSRRILDGPASKRRYWIAAMVASALLLGSLGVWLGLHDPTPDTAATDAPTPVAPQKSEAKPVPRHTTFLKPEAGIVLPRPDRRADGVLRKAAEISPMQVQRVQDQRETAGNSALPPEEVGEGFIASKASNAEPSPVDIAPPSTGVTLPTVARTNAALPTLENRDAPVSQGVTEARLIHQVQPVYPAQALALRLSGDVTLNATIAADGRVRGVGVVSGQPVLAAAAIDAVRKWRYAPSLLDGKPVAVEKQITVAFKLP
jgi:TonB family protein